MLNKQVALSQESLQHLSKEQLIRLLLQKDSEGQLPREMKGEEWYLYKKMFEDSPDAIFLTTVEDRSIVFCNEGAVRMFELESKSDFLGMSGQKFRYLSQRSDGVADEEKVFDDNAEIIYSTRSGRKFWGLKRSQAMVVNHQLLRFVRITDINDKKLAEIEVEEQRARLSSLIENTDGLVWSVDKNNLLTACNTRVQRMARKYLGVNMKIGESVFTGHESLPPDMRESWKKILRQAMSGKKFTTQIDFELEGVHRYWEFFLHPVLMSDGTPNGATIFGRDITERVRTEQELKNSEKKFRTLVSVAPVGIFLADGAFNLTWTNHSLQQIGRLSLEESLGTHFWDRLFLEDRKALREAMQAKREVLKMECRYRKNGDHYAWLLITLSPLLGHSAALIGYVGIVEDVSDRKLAQDKLKQSEQEYKYLFDNSPNPIFIAERESGAIQDVNEAAVEKYAYRRDELLRLHFPDLQGGPSEDRAVSEPVSDAEQLHYKKTGEELFVQVNAHEFIYKGKECCLLLVNDITQRKAFENQLLSTQRELEVALKTKDDFLSVMSHEIRTPLNAITGMAHLLKDQELAADQQEVVETLEHSSQHLLSLINDILDFSKLQAGKLELEQIPFDSRKLLAQARKMFEQQAQEKDIQLVVDTDENVPRWLKGDPTRINQIIYNLLSNAIKFTEQGKVSLQLNHCPGGIRLVVSDTGIGMSQEEQDRIFEAFTQASSSTNRKYGGTGLGLTITRRLVELQEGRMEVRSRQGTGTVFEIMLPLPACEPPEETAAEAAETDQAEEFSLLYVEDVLPNQFLMQRLCSGWNYRLRIARSGLEALEILENGERFDLILMDIMMPEIDGYETTDRIRAMQGAYFAQVPILAVTASVSDRQAKRYLDHGMNDFVEKPLKPDLLRQKIRQYVDRKEPMAAGPSKGKSRDKLSMFALLDEYHQNNPGEYRALLKSTHNYVSYYRDLMLDAIRKNDHQRYTVQNHKLINLLMLFRKQTLIARLNELQQDVKLGRSPENAADALQGILCEILALIDEMVRKSKNLPK